MGSSDAHWSARLERECEGLHRPFGFRDVAEELRRQGKLSFPGEKHWKDSPWTGFGSWTTDDLFIVSMGLHFVAYDDINKLNSAKGVHLRSILPGEAYPANTIVEYDRAAIQSIRAKYRPGIRKVIARFFKGNQE